MNRNFQYFCVVSHLCFFLSACGFSEKEKLGKEGYLKGFIGGVAADEPRAVLEGQKILSAGGNAVDAATAVYFTLAVTLPSKASLGGGGVCMVFDQKTKSIIALDFLNRVPGKIPGDVSRPSAVPGNPLGMFVLHNRFGRFQWASLVAIGEKLARFGTQVSRTLVDDFKPVANALILDRGSREIFLRGNGQLITEGSIIRQIDLANILSNLRRNGPADLYHGKLARRFVRAVKQVGGSLSLDDLMVFKPKWRKVLSKKFGNHEISFTPPPSSGGLISAQIFGMLEYDDLFEDASFDEKYHVFAEVALRSFGDRARWLRDDFSIANIPQDLISNRHLSKLMKNYRADRHLSPSAFKPGLKIISENPSATSFVIVDREGSAVTCALTMNNTFGTGRIANGTGIMLATAPTDRSKGPTALGPIIIRNKNSNNLFFAGAASGGMSAPTALINVIARSMIDNEKLLQAISSPRVYHGGMPDITFYEPRLPEKAKSFLIQRGHHIAATPLLGLVNAVYCSGGLPRDPETCVIKTDPRGSGLASDVSE